MSVTDDVRALNFAWLLRLRWSAIAGQAATVAAVHAFMGYSLPLVALGAIIAFEAASNVAAHRLARPSDRTFMGLLVIDLFSLTALLYLTGGAHNPFNFLYLVYIALASVVLSSGRTWTLALVSALLFGALFFWSVPLEHRTAPDAAPKADTHAHHGHHDAAEPEAEHAAHDGMSEHLRGMWVAFCVAAVFIVYFVTRVSATLAERDLELVQARARATRSERLAALGTLAAGAAHELGTPLSTIKLVASELQDALERDEPLDGVRDDMQLILGEVQRCRDVLEQLGADAGRSAGEALSTLALEDIVERALEPVTEAGRVQFRFDPELQLEVYPSAFARVLRSLVKNALAASKDGEVSIEGESVGGRLILRVTDTGSGMSEEVLSHALEPFYTTRATGEGMGLGLFLALSVIERLGGQLTLDSEPGRGTTALISLPAHPSPETA